MSFSGTHKFGYNPEPFRELPGILTENQEMNKDRYQNDPIPVEFVNSDFLWYNAEAPYFLNDFNLLSLLFFSLFFLTQCEWNLLFQVKKTMTG